MPKSRGRRPQRGGKKPIRRSPRPLRSSDLLIRDARRITGLADPLQAEAWASDWLGRTWLNAPMGEREAEHSLYMEVCGRACTTPSPHGLAAVAALTRVAPVGDTKMLAGTVDILAETQPLPPWHTAAGPGWTATAAWRAADVWDSERVLLIEYDGPHPHTLMAATRPDLDIFSNNEAERTIRPVKVQQRGSGGCWRTLTGLAEFALVQSYLSTAAKWGIGKLDALRGLFNGGTWLPPGLEPAG